MFKYTPIEQQALQDRAKINSLQNENNTLAANLDYLAMMCDVELETTEEVIDDTISEETPVDTSDEVVEEVVDNTTTEETPSETQEEGATNE